MIDYSHDIIKACDVLKSGGLILYPTDTIWGIGCDATNAAAVQKIFDLKKRADSKALIILLAEESDVNSYIFQKPDLNITKQYYSLKPVTIIYENGKGVAPNVMAEDGSLAIRVVKDDFCKRLIKQFGKAIVSTSANVSGFPSPSLFKDISNEIKNGVDYIVQHRTNDLTVREPSSVLKIKNDGSAEVVRM